MSNNNRTRSDSEAKGSKPGRRGKIPILLSVSLRNLCPLSKEELQLQSKNKKYFRPDHATSLLNHVRLDIVIAPPKMNSDENKGEQNVDDSPETTTAAADAEDDGFDEKVIYSALAPMRTINPSWNHLDEVIEDYLKLDGYFDSETGFYRYMRLRIWIVPENNVSTDKEPAEMKDLQAVDPSDPSRKAKGLAPLMDISIHPTKLQRLAKTPERVPINSLILNFSDGSVRVTSFLRDVLGDHDQGSKQSDENLKDDFGRFGDDVFRTLDSVTPVKRSPSGGRSRYLNDATDPSHQVSSYSEDSNDESSEHAKTEKGNEKQRRQLLSGMHDKFAVKEIDATREDFIAEQQELGRLILLEEAAIAEEEQSLQREKSELRTFMGKASEVEANMAVLGGIIQDEMELCRKFEFFLEAKRLKILRDLRRIYPILISQEEERYCIRNLRIPADIYGGGVAEEELSAALGFLCHLISLVSKYLSVPLRYRVFCNSSRSAIQDDTATIFPLFQARAVERDQLGHGVLLLHRNVECILKTRDIDFQSQEHILVKSKLLFDTTVDGID